MRIAIVTESFLPEVNGVTNSVLRVLEHLRRRGHSTLLVAPGSGPRLHDGVRVARIPAVPMPVYRSFAVGLPHRRVEAVLAAFAPDVVHLASPVVLGAHAATVAARLGVPTVAVYQTDVAGFAARYGAALLGRPLWSWLRRVHNGCDRTLAPSSPALWDLRRHGIVDVHLWARGVDAARFSPVHRDEAWRRRVAPAGEVIVGYVGRLAAEKRLGLLAPLQDVPGVRLVLVGDGPARAALERRMPRATFLGFADGQALSTAFASLDVFVHPGRDETFCQAAQEALASGVPVVAPAAGGLLDLVRDEATGLLVDPDDADAVATAAASLAGDPATRARYAQRARATVASRSWEAVGDQLVGHYAALTTEAAGRAGRPVGPLGAEVA